VLVSWNLAEGNGGCNGPIKHPGQSEYIYGTEQKTGMFACDFFQRKVHLLERSLTDNHFQCVWVMGYMLVSFQQVCWCLKIEVFDLVSVSKTAATLWAAEKAGIMSCHLQQFHRSCNHGESKCNPTGIKQLHLATT
jgi:hypothetical protein